MSGQNRKVVIIGILGVFLGYGVVWLRLDARLDALSQDILGDLDTKHTVINDRLTDNLAQVQSAIVQNIHTAGRSVVSIVATRNVNFLFGQADSLLPDDLIQREVTVGGGSGIFVIKDGYVLTNKHVVQDVNTSYSVIDYEGNIYEVQNVWLDPILDLAVLKVATSENEEFSIASIIPFAEEVQVGQFAIAIGNTLNELQNSVTFGIVSAKGRQLVNLRENIYVGLLQTDTPINPGNSGGPLLDIYGRVIGLNTAINSAAQSVWFALPITQEFVDATLYGIMEESTIVRPYLGVAFVDITPAVQTELDLQLDEGVYIQEVIDASPAAQAGLKAWDIVVSLNGRRIDQNSPFLYQLYTHIPGSSIELAVIRSGDPRQFSVILGSSSDL
jgi:serine protease Do